MSKEKVVLAYSGGLDTTAIIPWLKENFDYEVICCCIDCGQGEELDGLEERAKLSGASKLYIENIIDEFCDDYIVPCVKAGAVYERKSEQVDKSFCIVYGPCSPVKMRSNTAKLTVLIFHLMQNTATAVTVICGISAMKGWSWKILHVSQTTMTFLSLVFLLKKHQTKENMSP